MPPERGGQEQAFLNERTTQKVRNYVDRGLTIREATDLVTFEGIEQQGGILSPEDAKRKQSYLAKLEEYGS